MPALRPVIVDTNILFSALLSSSSGFADKLLKSGHPFFACEQMLVELFKHKEKVVHASHISEDEIVRFYQILMRRINIYKEDLIAPDHWTTAYALCCDIDESDTPHVALTFALDGLLWTGDKKLKDGLRRKGFDSFFESITRPGISG